MNTNETPDQRFERRAAEVGLDPQAELRIGGHYVSLLRHADQVWISGQVPRVGDRVLVCGRVGAGVTLDQARLAARIGVLRALTLLRRELGSLDRVAQVLRLTVYVQCSPDFTQHSEVADGASDLLHEVLDEAGRHTRTSVGVYQLPKDAAVEVDLVAAVRVNTVD